MAQKILIADDDYVQRDLYFELFREAGYDVITANDGQEAWEKIEKDPPNLVWTGIQMPRMTGFELVDLMRHNKPTETTPVIIFSHLGRPEDREKAKKLAFVEFMLKGFDRPVNILKKVQDLLASQRSPTPEPPDNDNRQGYTIL